MVSPALTMAQAGPLRCQVLSGVSEGNAAQAGSGTTTTPITTERAITRRTQWATPERNGRRWPLLSTGRALAPFGVTEYTGRPPRTGKDPRQRLASLSSARTRRNTLIGVSAVGEGKKKGQVQRAE